MVSGHSGLPEQTELRMMSEKARALREQKEERMGVICGVLDQMPPSERRRILAEIIRKYEKMDGER